jgi:hypothetical protein
MADPSFGLIIERIQRTHGWLLKATEELTAEEVACRFGRTAPPIGWHLWHISRWADRLQASLPNPPFTPDERWDPQRQLWVKEDLAREWGLDPESLGILEAGPGMDHDAAASVGRIRRERLLDYARRVFGSVDQTIAVLRSVDVEADRNSIVEFRVDERGGQLTEMSGARTTVAADLAFHLSHASRHLGMIEALRGLLDRSGTATL